MSRQAGPVKDQESQDKSDVNQETYGIHNREGRWERKNLEGQVRDFCEARIASFKTLQPGQQLRRASCRLDDPLQLFNCVQSNLAHAFLAKTNSFGNVLQTLSARLSLQTKPC